MILQNFYQSWFLRPFRNSFFWSGSFPVVVIKPSFRRDERQVKYSPLSAVLIDKIIQIKNARSIENITGLKPLRGYSTQYRTLVKSGRYSYRIGATIRGNTLWLVRFLPRNKIYKEFP